MLWEPRQPDASFSGRLPSPHRASRRESVCSRRIGRARPKRHHQPGRDRLRRRCEEILPHFMKPPGARVVAVCDVHSGRLAQMRATAGGEKVQPHHDYRKLLEDKDVNVVIVATNAHWHVLCCDHACQAGKDVYVEKPRAISSAKAASPSRPRGSTTASCRSARSSTAANTIGRPSRSSSRAGSAHLEVKVWDCDNWAPGRGSPPDCDPPKELDWDFYVGPSPMMPYNPNCYYNYGYDWFKTSGGGHQVAWGVHHFDIVNGRWASMAQRPSRPPAAASSPSPTTIANGPTRSRHRRDGPGPVAKNGFVLQYTMRIGCRREQRSHSKCFYGTEAALWIDRGRYTIVGETPRAARRRSPTSRCWPATTNIATCRYFWTTCQPQEAGGRRRGRTLRDQRGPLDERGLRSRPQDPLGRPAEQVTTTPRPTPACIGSIGAVEIGSRMATQAP